MKLTVTPPNIIISLCHEGFDLNSQDFGGFAICSLSILSSIIPAILTYPPRGNQPIPHSNSVVDILGELGVDGTGTSWEYEDGRAERKIGQNPSSTFDANDWNIDNDSGGGNGPHQL